MEIKKIVVGTDFSPEAKIALDQAVLIACHTGAEIVLVHAETVHEPLLVGDCGSGAVGEYERICAGHLEGNRKRLAELREHADGSGVTISHMVIDSFPDTSVVTAGKELDADLILVGTHGRTGLKRLLLGSVAERVVRLSDISVMVVREGESVGGYRRILVPTDFSASAAKALETALVLAHKDAEIHLLHCWRLPSLTGGYLPATIRNAVSDSLRESIEGSARRRGRELLEEYRGAGFAMEFDVMQASPGYGILQRAPEYDLVITGSHGRRGVRRFVLGSVAELTVRHAPCSVLVVHGET